MRRTSSIVAGCARAECQDRTTFSLTAPARCALPYFPLALATSFPSPRRSHRPYWLAEADEIIARLTLDRREARAEAEQDPKLNSRDSRTGPVHVIAHRGGAAHAPENTLIAFQRSLEAGASEVETDVRLSRDGALVLFHDEDLALKTSLTGSVESHSLAELRSSDIGSWFDRNHPNHSERFAGTGLLALTDLFEAFGRRLYYHLEIKGANPDLPDRILAEARSARVLARVALSSFSEAPLRKARSLDAAVPLTWLLPHSRHVASPVRLQRARIEAAIAAGFDEVSLPADEVTLRLVEFARSLGLSVRAWRVRNHRDMQRVIDAGVNGMTIDDPDALFTHLLSTLPAAMADDEKRG
jgi:glycerophosphoryl diester phosphodiesterase